MVINHNISAMNTLRQLTVNNNSASKSLEKLSSGMRINRAADDAAGLSISEKMRSQIRGLDQAVRNAQDGVSFLQTAEGALTEVSDMLVRMKELAVQYANGTYNEKDQANMSAEFDALCQQIANIVGQKTGTKDPSTTDTETKFNGIKVFSEGAIISMGEDGLTQLNIDSADLSALEDVDIETSADIDAAIDAVNKQRAVYGAQQNQLEHAINNMNATSENLSASESRIRDVDMAKEMMNYTKNNILLQAAQSMLAQANSAPQGVLSLLR